MPVDFLTDLTFTIYPRIYRIRYAIISLGVKSYINRASVAGAGIVNVGNFSSLANDIIFELGLSDDHNYRLVSPYGLSHLDWVVPADFYPNYGMQMPNSVLNVGSSVWIGRGCRLKVKNPDKPLNIGNGAVIAADSVVVKDVPPYAIVGGNPAKIIKYRFDKEIIEAFERIQWWNWDLEKIYDNFHLFKNPVAFAKKFDPKK